MKHINEQKKIEEYLDGTLNQVERKEIEDRIKKEPEFAKEVAVWQTITEGIGEVVDDTTDLIINDIQIEEGLTNIHAQLEDKGFYKEKKTPKRTFGRIIQMIKNKPELWFLAAAVLGLLFYIPTTLLLEKDRYVALDREQLFEISRRGGNTSEMRIQKLLQDGFDHYDQSAYRQAIPFFLEAQKISNSGNLDSLPRKYYYPRISVYLGCAYLADEQFDKVINCLEPVYQKEAMLEKVKSVIAWYLARAYYKSGREDAAAVLWEELRDDAVYGAWAVEELNEFSN